MFSSPASSCPGDAFPFEQCDTVADPLNGVDKSESPHLEGVKVSRTLSNCKHKPVNITCFSSDQSPPGLLRNHHFQQWVKSGRFDQDGMWPDCHDRQELPSGQVDHARDKNHHHIRKMLSESATEGMREFIQKGKREIC